MEEAEDNQPLFLINSKSLGKNTHNFLLGDYSFYRQSVKPTGYAIFSCKGKGCLSCHYSSKDASETDEEPTILRLNIFKVIKSIL